MPKPFAATFAVLLLSLGWMSPVAAAEPHLVYNATAIVERLLGSDREETQLQSCLLFSRTFGAHGTVAGALEVSTAAEGVPRATMLEALKAFALVLDLKRDLRDGDRFYVRYEQSFTGDGDPIGVGRVLWAELRTHAKGTIAIHRFRTKEGLEQFWLTSGLAAAPPVIRLPLDIVNVSSGFGLRHDPLDQPAGKTVAMGPLAETSAPAPEEAKPVPPPVAPKRIVRDFRDADVDPGRFRSRTARAKAAETQPAEAPLEQASVAPPATSPVRRPLFMHEGVDLVAPIGTPIFAAADGMVIGAGPNGGYGNWIRIDHAGRLATVYGHLSHLAPGIEMGAPVIRGELLGFVGNTGRSTGPHLHFELLSGGQAVSPLNRPELQRAQLGGYNLDNFRKQVAAALRERDREAR